MHFLNNKSSCNLTSFKGKDGNIRYLNGVVIKTFHSHKQKEYQVERDTLELLTKAKFPFAPKLIEAKDQTKEVVMEEIKGTTLLEFLPIATKEQIEWIKTQLRIATNALAKLGVVHGDVNRMNVIVKKDSSNCLEKLFLIDFSDVRKSKSIDTAQLADDMLNKKHMNEILDKFLIKT